MSTAPSQTQIIREILQHLGRENRPGVALLVPLSFGGRRVIEQVIAHLKQPGRRELIVRLVPKPDTADEKRLYGALYHDLRRGLELELGQPLPAEWRVCFPDLNAPEDSSFDPALNPVGDDRRLGKKISGLQQAWDQVEQKIFALQQQRIQETRIEEKLRLQPLIEQAKSEQDQIESQLKALEERLHRKHGSGPLAGHSMGPTLIMDEENFEGVLTQLLEGPVRGDQRILILAVEGLSRVEDRYLKNWAWLISRLTGNLPMKLLVWGGQELYDLCSEGKYVDGFSPFQQLKQIELVPFSADEVNQLVAGRINEATGAGLLYSLTQGHPAFVNELLERAAVELCAGDESGLRSRALATAHLRRLRHQVEQQSERVEALRRMVRGDRQRRNTPEENDLYWLGIVREEGPTAWKWAAPVLEEWAARWLG